MRSLHTFSAMLIALVAALPAAAETLVIQTWSGVWENGARAVGDAFAKKYNVEVKYELQQNTRLGIAKLRAQKDDPTIDIAFSTNDALEQAAAENLLVAIDMKAAPGLAALPPKFVHKNYLEVMNILFGLVYRKDLAPFDLTKWSDLADPRLKGKLGVPTAQFAGGRWLIMAALANGGNENNMDPGMAYLKRLKPNIVSFYATDGESVKVVQSGEAAVAGLGILSDFAKLLGPTSQYRFVIPDGPVLTSVVSVGMAVAQVRRVPRAAGSADRVLRHHQLHAGESQRVAARCDQGLPSCGRPDLRRRFLRDQQEAAGVGRVVQEGNPGALRE
jgi:spermidine/putrescine-binding protein